MSWSLSRGVIAIPVLLLAAGCTDLGVGRPCLFSGEVAGTQISAPALECMSKLCYLRGDDQNPSVPKRNVCTARCNSDDDCKSADLGNTNGKCPSHFVCAIATTVDLANSTEQFKCQSLCICADDLTSTNQNSTSKVPCCPTACADAQACPPNIRNTCT